MSNKENEKRLYNRIKIRQKIEIIDRSEAGESRDSLATSFNISESALHRILSGKVRIRDYWEKTKESRHGRDKVVINYIENTQFEKRLYEWFQSNRSAGQPLSGSILKEKALQLNKELGGSKDFKASNGWLHYFKKCHGIRQVAAQGEKLNADHEAAEKCCQEFPKKLEGYHHDNTYNADEPGVLEVIF